MAEDYGKLCEKRKELYDQVLKFRDFVGTNRLKRLMILYLFLKIPTNNFDIDDIVKLTKSVENKNIYQIIHPFRENGWIEDIGKAQRKIIFTLPANRYGEARSYFFDTLFSMIYSWRVSPSERAWVWEHWDMFSDILARNPVELQAYREDWVKKNIENEQERARELRLLTPETP
jgi:hypothetical protein